MPDTPPISSPISPLRRLTDVGNDKHGATEVVQYLLEAVGREIVSFQRNTHVSYMLAERARDIIKAITVCIKDVDTTGEWESYEKFSEAIEPLERMLFDLFGVARDDKLQYLVKTDDTTECILLPESWASRKKQISDLLDRFDASPEFNKLSGEPDAESRKQDRLVAQFHDDKTLLEEMTTQIKAILFSDPKKFPAYVTVIKDPLDTLQTAAIIDSPQSRTWLMELTIKTSMLIEGIAKILEANTADLKIQNRLKSTDVWEPALALINFLNEKNAETSLPADAKVKYEAFLNSISGTSTIGLPGDYATLVKKVGHIRRPFQAQAITVVKLCYILATQFNTIIGKSAVTIENFNSLEAACKKTLGALEDAINATKAVTNLIDIKISDFENLDAVKAFGEAQVLIKDSFTALSIGTDWTKYENNLGEAVGRDKDRVTELHKIIKGDSGSAPKKVKVTVKIEVNGTAKKTTSVDVEETTRLSALRWSVAEELDPADVKLARAAGTFYKAPGGTTALAIHSTIQENADTDGNNANLKLVVA